MRSRSYVRGRKMERDVERAVRRIGAELAGEHRRILAWSAAGWSPLTIARALGTEVDYVDAVLDRLTERLRLLVGFYPSKRQPGRVFTFPDRRDTVAFAQERGWLDRVRPAPPPPVSPP